MTKNKLPPMRVSFAIGYCPECYAPIHKESFGGGQYKCGSCGHRMDKPRKGVPE